MFLLLTYLCAILRRSRMPASTTMPAMPCQHGSFALSTGPPLRSCLEMALKAGTTYKYKDSRQFSSDSRRDKTLAITPNIHHARKYVNYTPPLKKQALLARAEGGYN